MKIMSLLTVGSLTALATVLPLQQAHARDGHGKHRDRPCAERHHPHNQQPSQGLRFSFNFSPRPIYRAPAPVYGINRSVVEDVQVALSRRGYLVGPIDGIPGTRTRSALADFQYRHGIQASGEINRVTLRALGLI
jgi:hypothetical protein